ncbi:MAG TPA: hypothetical protein VI955_02780, partial [Candidatus Omnitrophota bacterium]|nr:hypothetical protein [Candidatus Omnitrophota bacterium]
ELDLYSEEVAHKHRVLVANKMDLPSAEANLKTFKRKVSKNIIAISAKEKEGLTNCSPPCANYYDKDIQQTHTACGRQTRFQPDRGWSTSPKN